MTLSIRSPRARWLVPVAAAAAIGIGVGASSVVAGAATTLPPKTAAQLLADLARTPEQPLSGTVVQTSRLGLPELPGPDTASFQSLLSGSHTARVWYGSPTQARVSLVGDLAQADVIRRGTEVWTWSSAENTATRYTLPAGSQKAGRLPGASPSAAPVDPAGAAELALESIDPTTAVTVDGSNKVAGRAAYELVLAPRDARSLVGEVRLAVDSETSVPLRVQVFAKGATEAAVETAFTSVQFERPADSVFAFTPPAGAKVVEGSAAGPAAGVAKDAARAADSEDVGSAAKAARGAKDAAKDAAARAGAPRVVGSGWTSVAVLEDAQLAAVQDNPVGGALLGATTEVSGSYGSGRLLSTPLLSVLILDDGTVLAGAVQPAVLEEAAATLGDR